MQFIVDLSIVVILSLFPPSFVSVLLNQELCLFSQKCLENVKLFMYFLRAKDTKCAFHHIFKECLLFTEQNILLSRLTFAVSIMLLLYKTELRELMYLTRYSMLSTKISRNLFVFSSLLSQSSPVELQTPESVF